MKPMKQVGPCFSFCVCIVAVVTATPTFAATIDLGIGFKADVNNFGTAVVSTVNTSGQYGGSIRWLDAKSSQFPAGYAPMAINDLGAVAGVHRLTADSSRAFTWRDTDNDFQVDTSEILDFQIGTRSHPISVAGINRNGVVVGVSGGFPFEIDGPTEASWTLNNGAITSLFYPNPHKLTGVARGTVATGINASATVAGYVDESALGIDYTGFVWDGGTFSTLSATEGESQAFGINDSGQIAGAQWRTEPGGGGFFSGGHAEAAIWNSRTQQPLSIHPSGAVSSVAVDINNDGQVIGYKRVGSPSVPSGFLWDSDHGIRNLSSFAGRNIATPMAISDSGFVVASTTSASNSPLVLFRVTQPTTYAVLVGSNASPVRGDRDADNVASRLQSDANWLTEVNKNNFQFSTDSPAAVNNFIDTAIADVAAKAQPQDTLLFFYAGHGSGSSEIEVDEELNAVSGGAYNDDMLAAALRDSRLTDIRKIVILDSCHSGGFLTNDLPLGLDQDLQTLQNFALLAASTEDTQTANDPKKTDGTGAFTNSILPLLTAKTSFDDLRDLAAIAYTDTITGFFRDEGFGMANVQLFAYASPDFDTSLPLNGVPVPEPSAIALAVFGIAATAGFRFRHNCFAR